MSDAAEVRSRGVCLESFRIDASSRAWMYLVPATVAIFLGALGVCTAFVTHGVFAHTDWFAIFGSAAMLAGLALAALVVLPVITHDEYVAALEGGLLWKLADEEHFLPWDEMQHVKWDVTQAAIVIARREGEPIAIARKFGRMSADLVAPRLEDIRRKASFNLV